MADDQIRPAQPGNMLMHIADRVLGRPLLMHPGKVEVLLHVLEGRIPLGDATLAPLSPDASRFLGSASASGTFRVDGGVAIVPAIGSLVNRGAWLGASSGLTSYEGLAKQLRDARVDRTVHAGIMDIDSPGGEATGMFAMAQAVREFAAEKPIIAVVNDLAASAAYGIASQATEIVVSPTSIVGSIGVVLTHLDRSAELAARGIRPTLIHAGAHKVDGNPFGPLSDAVRADLQAEVGKFYDQFVSLVAQGRGDRLNEQNARATEARTFIGQEAIDRGLADRMASFEAVLASLQSQQPRSGRTTTRGDRRMTGENTITQEAHTAAVTAARAEGHAAGLTEGKKLGSTEATARIGAILDSAEAKGNPALAAHFAFKTDMSAEAATEALKAAGPAAPAAAPPKGNTIEQRSQGANEFGAPPQGSHRPSSAAVDDIWKKAAADANRSIGAA